MKNFNKLFINPYNEIKKFHPIWFEEVEKLISDKIKSSEKQLKEEAEYEGQSELYNDDFLYERFKDNCENGMFYGNWQILKYFYRKLKIKIYYLMLGKNTFTSKDEEMYNYFNDLKVNEDNKCKPACLKIKSSTEVTEKDLIWDNSRKYTIYFEFLTESNNPYNDVLQTSYFLFYVNEFNALDDLIRNVKMIQKINLKTNLFDNNKKFIPLNFVNYENRQILNISINEIKDSVNENYKKACESEYNAVNLFTLYLNEDKKYNKLNKQLKKRYIDLYTEFKNTETYNLLADNEKMKLDRLVNETL